MPVIKPFKALRPQPELVTKVASPPYDVLNSKEARQLVKDNPYSFLYVNKAEIDFCLLYTSPSPRDRTRSRMPSSA